MPTIKAVTFDLWQTLIIDEQERGRARARLRIEGAQQALQSAGHDFPQDRILEAYRNCWLICKEIRERGEDVTFHEQIGIFVEQIDPGLLKRLDGPTVTLIATRYADSFHQYPPGAHPDALRVLEEVKGDGCLVGLISNTGMTPGRTFRVYLERLGLLHLFDTLTFSDEARMSKPSVELFRRTTRELRVLPEETVHVGDHLLNDIVGASRAGMHTIWIAGFDDSEVDIKPDVTINGLGEVGSALGRLSRI